jgi:hypothetical protein
MAGGRSLRAARDPGVESNRADLARHVNTSAAGVVGTVAAACIAVAWLIILAVPVELFVMSRPDPVSPWLVSLLGVVLAVVAGAMIVTAAVALTGHPRRAVPPYLRDKPRS